MSLETVKKYVGIQQIGLSASGKTKVFGVWSKRDDAENNTIGIIKWHGAWRKYVYETDNAFYDWDCLRLIADFCETATKEHRL